MLDDFSVDQNIAFKILKNSILTNKCSHAYLFNTNGYSKGYDLALAFAKFLLCPSHNSNSSNCGDCNICHLINENAYSDLKIINSDGLWIKKEQTDELQSIFSLKSTNSGKLVYIINGADKLNVSASNSILKFLEEPVEDIVAILITDNIYNVIGTIVSRCQVINLNCNIVKSDNMLFNVASILYNDSSSIDNFVADENSFDRIKHAIDFFIFLNKNKLDTIIYIDKYFNCYFSSKEDYLFAFDIMIMFFSDVINFKMNRDIVLNSFISQVEEFSDYDFLYINKCLNLLMSAKSDIMSNINLNLLMDKFIILMEAI